MYYPMETQIAPMTTIRRERLLPVRGQVLVQPGDLVGPQDVVARCEVPGEIRMLDVSRGLKARRDRVGKLVRVAEGDTVQAGDLLAAPWGLLGSFRKCRSPLSGQVVELDGRGPAGILVDAVSATDVIVAGVDQGKSFDRPVGDIDLARSEGVAAVGRFKDVLIGGRDIKSLIAGVVG